MQNLSQRLISIPEAEILAQGAAASGTASSSSATASQNSVSGNNSVSTPSNVSSTPVVNSDNNQEMDIDILQVQENVTVECDSAVTFSNNDSSTNNNRVPNEANSNEKIETSDSSVATIATTASRNVSVQQKSAENSQTDIHESNNTTNNGSNNLNNDCRNHQQQNAIVQQQNRNPLWWRENLNLDKSKLILIAFSKGCVVLNQVSLMECKNRSYNLYSFNYCIIIYAKCSVFFLYSLFMNFTI